MRPFYCLLTTALFACTSHAADVARTTPEGEPSTIARNLALPVKAVTSAGPGQAGYVHYFLLTHPDGELEYQVGIELENQRIAWSVPDIGVMVSDFRKKGTIEAKGQTYKVEHLHGIRPFAREADMQALQKALPARVAGWIDDKTPYCLMRTPGEPFCLSCGDFVVRILYPGNHPLIPALPRDFVRVTGALYTTDDLLLYLVGLHDLPDKRSMLARLDTLDLPAEMREDIVSMLNAVEDEVPTANIAVAPKPATAAPLAKAPVAAPASKPSGRIASRRTLGKKI